MLNKTIDIWENAMLKIMRVSQLSSSPPSREADSGLATPEPPQACTPPLLPLDFSTLFPDSDYSFEGYDFSSLLGGDAFFQAMPNIFAARSDDDGCSNHDSAFDTVRDEFSVGSIDLPSYGF